MLDPKAGPLIAVKLNIITRKTLGGFETDGFASFHFVANINLACQVGADQHHDKMRFATRFLLKRFNSKL